MAFFGASDCTLIEQRISKFSNNTPQRLFLTYLDYLSHFSAVEYPFMQFSNYYLPQQPFHFFGEKADVTRFGLGLKADVHLDYLGMQP